MAGHLLPGHLIRYMMVQDHDGACRIAVHSARWVACTGRGRSALTVNAVYRSLSIVLHH